MKPYIICVIDDDEMYQFSFAKQVSESPSVKKILSFTEGEEAIKFLVSNVTRVDTLPDVIFLDLNMPVMDGWDFLDEFIRIKPLLPKIIVIYVISSSVDSMDIKRARQFSDVSDYIIKPIESSQFEGIMNKM